MLAGMSSRLVTEWRAYFRVVNSEREHERKKQRMATRRGR